jgi:hypothetical protein
MSGLYIHPWPLQTRSHPLTPAPGRLAARRLRPVRGGDHVFDLVAIFERKGLEWSYGVQKAVRSVQILCECLRQS